VFGLGHLGPQLLLQTPVLLLVVVVVLVIIILWEVRGRKGIVGINSTVLSVARELVGAGEVFAADCTLELLDKQVYAHVF
jgi:uncharacterized membrane protein YgaE (UPF0421/DUF939 family)